MQIRRTFDTLLNLVGNLIRESNGCLIQKLPSFRFEYPLTCLYNRVSQKKNAQRLKGYCSLSI